MRSREYRTCVPINADAAFISSLVIIVVVDVRSLCAQCVCMSREKIDNFIHLIPLAKPNPHPTGVYVYALSAADTPNVIRYIGASKKCVVERTWRHVQLALYCKDKRTKTPVVAWLRSVLTQSIPIAVRILDHGSNDSPVVQGTNKLELRWIYFFCPFFDLTNSEAIRHKAGKSSCLDRLKWFTPE